MTEVNLEFIAHQLERVLADQRTMRNQLAGIREQLRIQGSAIARLNCDKFRAILAAHIPGAGMNAKAEGK